jgi:hypothetical protein
VENNIKNLTMQLPVLNGVIDRRILINYRVKPEVVEALLPPHLEPLIINGYASAGICLLRLKHIGMKYSPSFMRITSENAAHRFLVKFKEGNNVHGVYIPRRDTDSMLNIVLAGKLFSWPHYRASFEVAEQMGKYSLKMRSSDEHTTLSVQTELVDVFPSNSMFNSIDDASVCFQGSSLGISPSMKQGRFKAIELKTKTWAVEPLNVLSLNSSYFQNAPLFPKGSIEFDNALLMRGIEHEWLSHRDQY